MKLVKAYNSVSLVLRIVIGMAIGTALALLIPNAAVTAPGIGILAIGFIIGVIQDSLETAINSLSDALFTAVAEFKQWRKNGKEIKF